ncbi:hypothetical protein COT97_03380 [Candidatus Falkowbacteria bacterium CG10_big_fil_rev_8_21_14_0_10_39_11]|uniref:Uncharacterized protein n=1 Tax=Candidatus Falkowbacteria bacterium CG10_big_fil_rev_8_21_14_0_10_39_11 TaxID=1974565 RepID=A0A2H0V6U2_9BACT|nr:MAG: hypothetical protein COT97_03380 [Candidatus Falkowbacteria bacterium CG10_big_fil_rev_8_21_14_0_10_39_11]
MIVVASVIGCTFGFQPINHSMGADMPGMSCCGSDGAGSLNHYSIIMPSNDLNNFGSIVGLVFIFLLSVIPVLSGAVVRGNSYMIHLWRCVGSEVLFNFNKLLLSKGLTQPLLYN